MFAIRIVTALACLVEGDSQLLLRGGGGELSDKHAGRRKEYRRRAFRW